MPLFDAILKGKWIKTSGWIQISKIQKINTKGGKLVIVTKDGKLNEYKGSRPTAVKQALLKEGVVEDTNG